MRSVHGISVSGPTFPATIWRLFMEKAVPYAPFPKEFPAPKTAPVWRSHTLQYAMSGGYYSSSSSGYSSSGGTTQQPEESSSSGSDQGFVQVPENGDEP
jgi:hypothetical protein